MTGLRTILGIGLGVCLLGAPAAARAQVDTSAAATNSMPTGGFGFNLPTHLGTLSYSVSGSEMLETGFGNGDVAASTALSGNLAYISKSERDPFSVIYSGGYLFSKVPGSSESSTFQDLAASQVLRTRAWVFVVSDVVSYLPGAPTTGLSGVAGVGDVGVYPGGGLGPDQNILTNYAERLSNGLSGSATWELGPSLSLEGSASWYLLHFTGNGDPGINSSEYAGSFGPNYRIDARDSVGLSAYYSDFTYPQYGQYKIESEGLNVNFSRDWSRRFSTSFSFGPQITHGTTLVAIPAETYFAGSASARYATRTTGFTASYSRGVNAGSGVIFGAISDTVVVGMNRPLSRDWQLGINAGYARSVGLGAYPGSYVPRYDSVYAGAQVSRRLTESLSCYGSYTALDQTVQNNLGVNAFTGLNHIFGFGITFAPAPLISAR